MRKIVTVAVLAIAIASPASAKSGGMPAIWFKPEVHPAGTGDPAPVALPDGSWRVTCKELVDRCTELATASCPAGFDVVKDDYSDGGYTLTRTVKCH